MTKEYLENILTEYGVAFTDSLADRLLKEFEPCTDAISRQAALDTFGLSEKTRKYGGDHSGYDTIMLYEVQDALEALPLVTPHPKTGHWTHDGSHWKNRFIYSNCNYKLFDEPTNYCPNCGAKMQEVEE